MAAGIERCVRLGNDIVVLLLGGQVLDFIRYPSVLDPAIWCFNESELIDAGMNTER